MKLYELFSEDVVGMNPQATKPYFSPEEAQRANDEWVNQAQVDQEDGVIIKGTDGNQYRIMTSYNNEHFEDGEVYLDGVTDPTYIDTDGYPDAAELLHYHSPTGHYVEEQVPYLQRPNSGYRKAVADYLRLNPGKSEDDWKELLPNQQKKYLNKYVEENFADGKKKGKSKPGRVKRSGASCNGSVTALRKRAKNSSGEKAKMYHWCANMKSGKKKSK